MKRAIYSLMFTLLSLHAMSQQSVSRKDLLSITLEAHDISKVNVQEIVMAPGLKAPLHLHPCPVVGYVAEGILRFQIEGQEAQILKKGDAFFEPANKAVSHFDNASTDQPLKFIAFYLNNGKEKLIEMVEDKH